MSDLSARSGVRFTTWGVVGLYAVACTGGAVVAGCGALAAPPPADPKGDARWLPEMASIAGGSFRMGSPQAEPNRREDERAHKVSVPSFLLMTTEVTQGQWQAVTGTNPNSTRSNRWNKPCSSYKGTAEKPTSLLGDAVPVTCVTFADAAAFANTVSTQQGLTSAYNIVGGQVSWNASADGYRLPTEAEWEYAARGGMPGPFAGATSYAAVCEVANTAEDWGRLPRECSDNHIWLAPVASYKANEYGLFDMSGNAFEWVWDWYGEYPTSSQVNPTGPTVGDARVLRGGSAWLDPRDARVSQRNRRAPTDVESDIGFRLARNAAR